MGVKQISEITRRDIAMLFVDGYYDYSRYWPDSKYSSLDDGDTCKLPWHNVT